MNRRGFLRRATAGIGVSAVIGATPLNPLTPPPTRERDEPSEPSESTSAEASSTDEPAPAYQLWTNDVTGSITGLVSGASGDDLYVSISNKVYRIRAASGEIEWRAKSEQPIEEPAAIGDGTVFAGTRYGRLLAVDRETGDRLWFEDTNAFSPSGPTVYDATVVLPGRYLYGFDTESGDRRWTSDERFTSSRTLRSGRYLYVGASYNTGKVDLRDGSTTWALGDRARGPSFNLVLDAGRDRLFGTNGGTLYAVDDTSGELAWTADDAGHIRSLVLSGDLLVYLVETDAGNSKFGAIDLAEREIRWEKIAPLDIEGWEYGSVTTDLIDIGETVLVGTRTGHLVTIDPATGDLHRAASILDDEIDRLRVDGDRAYLTGGRVLQGIDLAETAVLDP